MGLAPVVIFAYDRKDSLKQTIESLRACELADETECYIFSDAYDSKKSNKERVCEVRDYLSEIKENNFFKKVELYFSGSHKGLASSVIDGVSDVIKKYGKVIVVEDDLLVSESFLRYMNSALQTFENNNSIWSISGYSLGLISALHIDSDIYLSRRGSSWGWGTWIDRWDSVDWDVSDYQEFFNNADRIRMFNQCGEDLSELLAMWKNKRTDSWAIRFDYAQFCQNKLSVFPKKSQVINLGYNGEGTNCNHSFLNLYKTYLHYYGSDIDFSLLDDYTAIEKEKSLAYSKGVISRVRIVIARWITRIFMRK